MRDVERLKFSTANGSRGHRRFKLYKSQLNRGGRDHYFYIRVIEKWNNLP